MNSYFGYWPSDTSFDNCSQRPDVKKEENNDVKKTDYNEAFRLIDGHEAHNLEEFPSQRVVSKIKTEILHNSDEEDVKKIELVDTFGSVHDNEAHDSEELMMDDDHNVLSEQINSKIDHEKLPDFKKEVVNKIEDVQIFEQFIDENGVHNREELNIKNDSNILSPQPDSIMEIEETHEQHSDLKNYICPLCDFTTNYLKNLRNHNNAVHLKLRRYTCQLCDYGAYKKNHFIRHMEGHTKSKVQNKEDLSIQVDSKVQILKNDTASEPDKPKKYKCSLCDFTTNNQKNLGHHNNSIHLKLKRYKCELCDYSAYMKCNFTRHMDGHKTGKIKTDGEKMQNNIHNCHLCDFTTKYKSNFDNHINSVHLKLKRYQCQLCDYMSFKVVHFQRHIEIFHLEDDPPRIDTNEEILPNFEEEDVVKIEVDDLVDESGNHG